MLGKRTDFAGKSGPGPGEYSPMYCKCVGDVVTDSGEHCKFESFIPRFTDSLVRDEIKQVCTDPVIITSSSSSGVLLYLAGHY